MSINDNYTYKPGTIIHNTYQIECVLGQGSFGITYLVIHLALNKKMAIKEFFMNGLNSRKENGFVTGMDKGSLPYYYGRKFKKEALNMALLDHPNVVRVTDSFEENGTFYYVMDYIEGQNLNDYINSHHILENEAVKIIKSVAEALIYMHETHHMLHLDLKPGNVMRRISDGHIFLIDFGLSKHYSEKGLPETSTSIGLGTLGYAPIEQENASRNGEFRPTIDVYALGATLYKLLTCETPPAAAELVSDENLVERRLQLKGVSQSLVDIVKRSMSPNVTKRFQTVRDFNNNLTNAYENESTIVEMEEIDVLDGNESFVNALKVSEREKNRKSQMYAVIGVISMIIIVIMLYV